MDSIRQLSWLPILSQTYGLFVRRSCYLNISEKSPKTRRNIGFGPKDTLAALELRAVEELIVWENLAINRYVLRHPVTKVETVTILNEKQEKLSTSFKDPESGVELEVKDKTSLLEWFASNFKSYHTTLNFVTNKSPEGNQFCKGFGGIGGLLRYKVDFVAMENDSEDDL